MKKWFFRTILVVMLLGMTVSAFAGSVNPVEMSDAEIEKSRILLLERALEPKDPYEAADAWAEGVKTRNGALQYAVMSPDLKNETYSRFAAFGWVTGVSSPWVESYEITEKYRLDKDTYRYKVTFTHTDSAKSSFTTTDYLTVHKLDDSWFISAIERVDVKGKITSLTLSDDKKLTSFFMEDRSPKSGLHDRANVIIGSETKIYEGYSDHELSVGDLKEGTTLSVTFTEDPMIMIYPVSARAKVIRVVDEDILPPGFELEYENIELKAITTAGSLSPLKKIEDRHFERANGEDFVLSLYADSHNKVSGVFSHGSSRFILPDLGYSHDAGSIELVDLEVNYENAGDRICLLAAAGSPISGYTYVFHDESRDEWSYYHNWGTPAVTDLNQDGVSEVLMEFEGLHNNPADGSILAFEKGQFTVSGMNAAIYENTGFGKDERWVSTTFKHLDQHTLVDIELYGDIRMCKSYVFNDDSLSSLKALDSMVYENTQYGFRFTLPVSWGNFTVVEEEWEGLSMGEQTGERVVETGSVIKLRHPLWTAQDPRQDIPIMVFTMDQWNCLEKEQFHIGAAPVGPKAIGHNSEFVFALPARYNYAFLLGVEEVEWILDHNPLKLLDD